MSTMTIAKLITFGEQLLLPHSDSAKLDTELLICFVIDKSPSFLLTWPEHKLSIEQTQHFADLLSRRFQGEPIAYIVKLREFWSLPLQVSPATLIPRPDTEVLVELVLSHHDFASLNCLDLGTGTGAIALALASERPQWIIEAVDYSHDAVALAISNANNLNLSQVNIYQSDWFNEVSSDKRFDIIVSNPPYIDEHDHHLNEGDVRYEPKSALVAADNGLADIKIIASQALNFLKPGGFLYIEHGFEQSIAVQKVLADLAYSEIETIKDYSNNDRITRACYSI
ncbi:protein-(glutamine-N5) methyltransferase, release factor-specific [Cognaticolwellia beringensis]|uniref:Release factor glutamine methyltransferase n=2 Tax=Cognaticolwellia beringensis TaxID=1967665 RepID=A0A222GER3_9GAMM|nr:protein-(glutamine-N5) methyltransferase, release factor-specific [Cognaticolwellia beringensis]